jgi:ubiquinone/menaquinone biosynthesis C-methylase UbiE
MADIKDVKKFWNENPLWTGEASVSEYNRDFFISHTNTIKKHILRDKHLKRIKSFFDSNELTLDIGCGIGFWLEYFKFEKIIGGDISFNSLKIARKRGSYFNFDYPLINLNAEKLPFKNESLNQIYSFGVLHHTPDTEKAFREISRVMKKDGKLAISLYYENFFLKYFKFFRPFIKIAGYFIKVKGRGRENMFNAKTKEEFVRYYDGDKNPIGKCYSLDYIENVLLKDFMIEDYWLYYSPKRFMSFKLPEFLDRFIERKFGLMITVFARKK